MITALVTVTATATMFATPSATAQSSFPGSAVFSAYASGTKQHVRLVDAGGQTLANVDTSFSAASANSQGLNNQINNVFDEPAQPVEAGKNSYSRAAAAEVSLGAKFPAGSDPSQVILPSLQEAAAAPSTSLLRKDLVQPINANPLLYVSAATDKNQALWNPNFCPLGQPI
ncbi:MAG: hypothetical protein JO050_10560, partial [Acidimicrobiia bacterium]|nr:hypothetical protein [Acidimicrobiia bacterium]